MTTTIIVAIVAVVVALLIAVPVTCKVAVNNKIQKDAEIVGTAEDKARSIIDEALKTAETKKREALLEVKEESLRTKNELEKETKERRNELQKYENRVLAKESAVDKKADAVEKREAECTARAAEVQKKEKRVEELEQKGVQELERVSGLTSEQAKEELLRSVEDDVKVDVARLTGNWKAGQRKKLVRRLRNMLSMPSRNVQLTMWLKLPFRLFSFRAMR